MDSDHSEGSTPDCAPARQSSVTLSHPESEEEMEEMEEEEMEEEEEEEVNGEDDREDESLTDDITDGGSFSMDGQQREGSSSGGSFEEMRSSSPDESLETSTVSEDVEELEGSLDGSQGSSIKQRSLDVHKHSMHCDEVLRSHTRDVYTYFFQAVVFVMSTECKYYVSGMWSFY